MSDLSITAADVKAVKVWAQMTGPAEEAFSAGEAIRLNTSSGKLTPGNATSDAEARIIGVAIKTANVANEAVTIVKKGLLDVGNALTSVDYDAALYLSDTDGTIATGSSGTTTKVVGRCVPAWGYTTADKLLLVDL